MYLIEKSHLPSFSPFRTVAKRPVPNNFDLISRSFDENVLHRLKALNSNLSPPSISLSWLSSAVDFLSTTHSEAQTLISNLKSSDESVAVYMDHSVKLLDLCNSISSEIERLRQCRLQMKFNVHLLTGKDGQIPTPEKLQKARVSLTECMNSSSQGIVKRRGFQTLDPAVLIGDLAAALRNPPPRGKTSSAGNLIRRTIHAVGLATFFVAGVLVSAMYGVPDVAKVRVPSEFLWADSVNDLQRQFFEGEKKWLLTEVDDVATRAAVVREVVDEVVSGGSDEVKKVGLESAVKELETVTDMLSDRLDGLSNGVDGMFKAVLSARNGVLEKYRGDHDKQSKSKALGF